MINLHKQKMRRIPPESVTVGRQGCMTKVYKSNYEVQKSVKQLLFTIGAFGGMRKGIVKYTAECMALWSDETT